jgi:hypothetical protein
MNQERALSILKTGANAFVTGEPGSGKTYLINAYIAYLEACKLSVAVTASTGIAATHIGGMTIHSWSGIGARDSLSPYDLDHIASQQKTQKRVGKAHTLIIDEISMLDGKLLDMVDRVCRAVRKNNDPFGGLQVVFVGDFFQLPPIAKMGEAVHYAFESPAWSAARPVVCYLDGQFRQEDEMLLALLQSIRRNEVEEEHYTLLSEQTEIGYEHIEPTRLFTHNADVDAVNAAKLRELPGMVRKFAMSGRGNKQLQESLAKNCLSPQLLELKEQAMVMCTKNNFEAGYVNGTLGRVVAFDAEDGYPIIETAGGRRIPIKPATWSVAEDNKVLAEIEQVPLRLAWAITIHKSQGMSLDAAEIDLTRAFAYGQGYVALSRVRTLAGLKLLGLGPNALGVDPKIVAVDARFRQASDEADDLFADMEEGELARLHEGFVKNNGGTVPSGEVSASPSRGAERLREESTYEETLRLLRDGRSVAEIAKERDIAESTVWSHLEKLREDGELTMKDLHSLTSEPDWDDIYRELKEGFEACGTEKLKPVFEYAKEQYGYPQVRLARIVYLLSSRG